jgi:hypothetical protein
MLLSGTFLSIVFGFCPRRAQKPKQKIEGTLLPQAVY